MCDRFEVFVFSSFRDEGQAVGPTEVSHEIFLSVQSLHHFCSRGGMHFSKFRWMSHRKWGIAADLFLQQHRKRGTLESVRRRHEDYRRRFTRDGRFCFYLGTSSVEKEGSTTVRSLPKGAPSLPEGASSLPEGAPSPPEGAPSLPEEAPFLPKGAPSLPEEAPSLPEGAPSLPKEAPSLPEEAPSLPFRARQDFEMRSAARSSKKGFPYSAGNNRREFNEFRFRFSSTANFRRNGVKREACNK